MEYRKLGSSDLNVSVIGFGAWGIGGAPFWSSEGDNMSVKSIQKAYDMGINFFDTAPVYGFGLSERLIGKALKPMRDKVILATKCGLRWEKEQLGSISKLATRKSILEEIDQSLERLDTDYIDLYQVHWPDGKTPHQETMETLLEIQKQGKIRHIGVSNYSVDQMQECLRVGPLVSLQPEYSLLQRSIENETVSFCLIHDIGIIAYSPLSSGVLTGKYDKDHVLMIGDAPGDLAAARAVGALFYPINPGDEAASWKRFNQQAFDKFIDGKYAGNYEAKLVAEFDKYLPENPSWI